MRFKMTLSFFSALLAFGFFFAAPVMATKKVAAKSALSTVKVKIGGMSCGGCAARITGMLQKLKGVKTASVSFEKKLAVVKYNKKEIAAKAIVAAITKAGYTAKAKHSCGAGCKCGKCAGKKAACKCKDCKSGKTSCKDCKGCKGKKKTTS